jgi:hypothetical protein
MHMIFHHFHGINAKLVFSYPLKDPLFISPHLSFKYMLPLFGHQYQMIFKIVDSLLGTSDSPAVFYNSYSINLARAWPLSYPQQAVGYFAATFIKRFFYFNKLWSDPCQEVNNNLRLNNENPFKRTSNISETEKSLDKTSQVLGSAGIEPATNRL